MSEQSFEPTFYEDESGDIKPLEDLQPDIVLTRPEISRNAIALRDLHPEFLNASVVPEPMPTLSTEKDTTSVTDSSEAVGVSVRSRQEKAVTMRERLGFDAESHDERNHALGNDEERVPGKYLNEIYHRQDKVSNTDDPNAALRSHVRRYKDYAAAAQTNIGIAGGALVALDGVNPGLPMVSLAEDLPLNEGAGLRAVNLVMARMVANGYIETEGQQPSLVSELTDEERHQLKQSVEAMSVGEFRRRLEPSIDAQRRRLDFWVKCLENATRHYVVRGMAHEALRSLGRAPEQDQR